MQIDNKSLVMILLALLVGGAALSAWNAFKTTTSLEPPAVSGEQHVEHIEYADCHESDASARAATEVAEQNQGTAGAGGKRCITQPKPEADNGFRPGVSGVP